MILDDLTRVLAALPPETYSEVAHLVTQVVRSPDPAQAEESADAILKKALG